MGKKAFGEMAVTQTQFDNDSVSNWSRREEEQLICPDFVKEHEEPPKIFWKYYDSYRRKKNTLSEYTIATSIPTSAIQNYLKNIVEKQPPTVENLNKI